MGWAEVNINMMIQITPSIYIKKSRLFSYIKSMSLINDRRDYCFLRCIGRFLVVLVALGPFKGFRPRAGNKDSGVWYGQVKKQSWYGFVVKIAVLNGAIHFPKSL
jgi:hypothetical protein